MDDTSAEFQNLKNLNAFLLKETSESRQQIKSLHQDKEALECAFNLSAMEKTDLEFRFSQSADDILALNMEKDVFFVFLATHVSEIGSRFERLMEEKDYIQCAKDEKESEIASLKEELGKLTARLENESYQMSRLSRERDELKNDFDGLAAEANLLRKKVLDAEKNESILVSRVEKLRMQGEKLKEEKDEKEADIRKLITERDLAVKKSTVSASLIEKLKGDVDGIMRDKNEAEKQTNQLQLQIVSLQLELKKLNELMKESIDQESSLRSNLLQFEKAIAQAVEKESDLETKIRVLRNEKKENQDSIKMLTERRDNLQDTLGMVRKELEERQRSLEEAIRAKDEIEQEKLSRENDIVELRRQVDQFRDDIDELKESCTNLKEENKKLLSEVDRFRNAAEEAGLARDDLRKGFDDEKNKVKKLMLQVSEMDDKLEQTEAELMEMRSEREKLIERNKMVENNVNILMKEKDDLQKGLVEAQRNSDDLRAKVESSNQALALLKSTAALVCHSKIEDGEEEVVSIENVDEEIVPYAEELDAIKSAFKNKDKMVEDMKLQLQNSTAEAQKRRNLLTVISSATTILAAAFAAYVARGR